MNTRTTITIDEDLLAEVKRRALDSHMTVSDFVQESLREGLARMDQQPAEPFTLTPADTGGYQPGVDITDNSALLAIMEDE